MTEYYIAKGDLEKARESLAKLDRFDPNRSSRHLDGRRHRGPGG